MDNYKEREIRRVYDYEVNEHTLLMTPICDAEYETRVLEPHFEYLVKRRPMEILKQACMENGSTLDGRVKFMRAKLGQRNKVPVLISESEAIIASPTHSPSSPKCSWIFTANVRENCSFVMGEDRGTLVTFKDRSSSFLNIPITQFGSLLRKALMCQGLLR